MTRTVKVGDKEVTISPEDPDTKLFVIDGFTLKVELCEDDCGNGWGIKYTTYVKGSGITPSVWFGDVNIEDAEGVKNSEHTKLFDGMTEEQAREGFDTLIGHAGGFIGHMILANQD